ncbi:helix-turn-helix transcriptional regulator [Propionivibrio dicarboxylicus]|uniref:AraC-type DNA-binding protein n=1 Tax=Propionivibrio dicarboxylicus TaxID=83767 RepID=A0A1G8IZJ3_9RHOO|nr:helix-turn-helix transcriptional regulator [Propionivibrio dicarboxylicus]SDI24359.1 AraC-type DNA-binding protein [Propionivibrio dicarboxylicus]
MLINMHGKLPTLNELAAQFGCSARLLNDDFVAEFGGSIYAFITSQRLDEAHEAILQSNVPLKTLAFKLGYAHVNHFITAFRKKYGYPPGSLRKQ